MKTVRARFITTVVAASWALSTIPVCAATRTQTFSDPDKPGSLQVRTLGGEIVIIGDADARAVSVRSNLEDDALDEPRSDGLRRLDGGPSVRVSEKDNVVTIDLLGNGAGRAARNIDLVVTAPPDTAVSIERMGNGSTIVRDLRGDLEVRALGDVKVERARGAAVIESVRGNIEASFAEFPSRKPVSFTTVRGHVLVWAPVDAKASVRFRTHQGEILTDFSEEQLSSSYAEEGGAGLRVATTVLWDRREAAELDALARDVASISRQNERIVWDHQKIIRGVEGSADAAGGHALSESSRQGRVDTHEGSRPPRPPAPPKPPGEPAPPSFKTARIPMPAISGGKVVAGALNGGGPELQVSTLAGSITLRKIE